MSNGARWTIAVLIIVYGALLTVSDAEYVLRGGAVGATFARGLVVDLLPGTPAERAHIVKGDRADLRDADLSVRMFVGGELLTTAGERFVIPIEHNGVIVRRTLVAAPTPRVGRYELFELAIAAIAYALLAAWVAIGARRISAIGLGVFAVSQISTPLLDAFGPFTLPLCALGTFLTAVGPLGLLWFALQVPDDRLSRARVIALAVGCAAALPVVLTSVWASTLAILAPQFPAPVLDDRYVQFAPFVFALASFAALLSRYGRRPETRARIAWLLPATLILVIALYPQPAYTQSVLIGTLLNAIPLLAVVCLAYAILKNHLIDVRFVVSRAVVYGSLTSLVIALVGLLDWLISGELASSKLAVPIEALAAVGIGFWLNALHDRIRATVEAVLFRERRRTEERIARAAVGLERCDDESLIPVGLVSEASSALDLASAALFVRRLDNSFDRTVSVGWTDGEIACVHADDPFLLHLAGADGPFRLHAAAPFSNVPAGRAAPRIALPVRPRNAVGAFVLYGLHASGADLDSAELLLLARLGEAAAHAYDTAETRRLRRAINELRTALELAEGSPSRWVPT